MIDDQFIDLEIKAIRRRIEDYKVEGFKVTDMKLIVCEDFLRLLIAALPAPDAADLCEKEFFEGVRVVKDPMIEGWRISVVEVVSQTSTESILRFSNGPGKN